MRQDIHYETVALLAIFRVFGRYFLNCCGNKSQKADAYCKIKINLQVPITTEADDNFEKTSLFFNLKVFLCFLISL